MLCSISGEVPQHPVASSKSGNVYEKRLIEAYISENHKDPVNGEELETTDLIDLKSSRIVAPRPPTLTSIPALLSTFQNEWDALALESFTIRQQLHQTRQELATALYQHDAAVRVITRLTKERDEARDALSKVTIGAGGVGNGNAMQVDSQGLPEELAAKVDATQESLSKSRRKRPIPKGWADSNTISEFNVVSASEPLCPGCKSLAVDSTGDLAIVGGSDGVAGLYGISAQKLLQTFKNESAVTDAVWYGNEPVLSTVSGAVRVFGSSNVNFTSHAGAANALALHPSGEILASVGVDKSFVFYDLPGQKAVTQVYTDSELTTAAFHPDGHLFAAGGADGQIKLFHVKTGESASVIFELGGPVQDVVFSENGIWFAAVAKGSNSITIFDIRKEGKAAEAKILEIGGQVDCIRWDYTGQYLAASGPNGLTISHYSKSSKSWSDLTSLAVPATAVAWGTEASSLVTVNGDGKITVLGKRSFAEMSQHAALSPSPILFRTSSFGNAQLLPRAPSIELQSSFSDRRRTSHPHNIPIQQRLHRSPSNMPERAHSQQRPRLEHRTSQTIIDLTEDGEELAAARRRNAQTLDVIDLTDDAEAEISIIHSQPVEQRPIPPPHHHIDRIGFAPSRVVHRNESPGLFVPPRSPPPRARQSLPHQVIAFFGNMGGSRPGQAQVGSLNSGVRIVHDPHGRGHHHNIFHVGLPQVMPDLDYQVNAFEPRQPDHLAPPAAQTGFTRSPTEDDVVICPSCEEELIHNKDEAPMVKKRGGRAPTRRDREEHPFWVVKECGHVFCNRCYQNRMPLLNSEPTTSFRQETNTEGRTTKKVLIEAFMMDHLSSYQQLEQKWRETHSRREQEDVDFTAARDKAMDSLSQTRKVEIETCGEVFATRAKETEQEESEKYDALKAKHTKELQELLDKHAEELDEREEARKERLRRIAETDDAAVTMIDDKYRGKETELEEEWADKKMVLQNQRNAEDVKAKEEVFNLFQEQSRRAPSSTPYSIADSNDNAIQSKKKHKLSPESSGSFRTVRRSPTSNPTSKRQKAIQSQRNATLNQTRPEPSTPTDASARSVSIPSPSVTPKASQQASTASEAAGLRQPKPLTQMKFPLRSIQARAVGSAGPWSTWRPSLDTPSMKLQLYAPIFSNTTKFVPHNGRTYVHHNDEWVIIPSLMHRLSYNQPDSLVKVESTGRASNTYQELWLVFQDSKTLAAFLRLYREEYGNKNVVKNTALAQPITNAENSTLHSV